MSPFSIAYPVDFQMILCYIMNMKTIELTEEEVTIIYELLNSQYHLIESKSEKEDILVIMEKLT
ncbi:MAG: hypothetical protein ABFD50_15450 [Smithella sp.]